MKKNKLITSILAFTLVVTSCGEQKETPAKDENTTETQVNDSIVTEEITEEIKEEGGDMYMTVQQQWDQLKDYVEMGNTESVSFYCDSENPKFSQENWNYVDFEDENYFANFSFFGEYSELDDASNFAPNAKVITINFKTQSDGMTFESQTKIYFQVRSGHLWIIGCELIG